MGTPNEGIIVSSDKMLNDNETITVWTQGTLDEYGNSTPTKRVLKCQILEKVVNIIDSMGIETTAQYTIRSKSNIDIDELIDINGNGTFNLQKTKPVKNRVVVKDLRNRVVWYKIWV